MVYQISLELGKFSLGEIKAPPKIRGGSSVGAGGAPAPPPYVLAHQGKIGEEEEKKEGEGGLEEEEGCQPPCP